MWAFAVFAAVPWSLVVVGAVALARRDRPLPPSPGVERGVVSGVVDSAWLIRALPRPSGSDPWASRWASVPTTERRALAERARRNYEA